LLPSTTPLLFKAASVFGQELPSVRPGTQWPEYLIRRERDELFLRLRAIGYRDSGRHLIPLSSSRDHLLIFTLNSQHYAEKALPVSEIPAVFKEPQLQSIELLASAQSKLVFRVHSRKHLSLSIEELLAWQNFELVLPDLDRTGHPYDLEIPDSELEHVTTVEMPWGIELSPVSESSNSHLTFSDPLRLRGTGVWTELWTTALVDKRPERSASPIPIEVLRVRPETLSRIA
jgi:hypothetical protein